VTHLCWRTDITDPDRVDACGLPAAEHIRRGDGVIHLTGRAAKAFPLPMPAFIAAMGDLCPDCRIAYQNEFGGEEA
jgi:hypothetical protein